MKSVPQKDIDKRNACDPAAVRRFREKGEINATDRFDYRISGGWKDNFY